MKVKEESLIGSLAILGLAAGLAYLGPKHAYPPERRRSRTNEKAPALDTLSSGRGRHAQSPAGIPAKGWKDIFWRTYEQINEDRLLAVAAGVVFTACWPSSLP
jgi:membrane protein